MICGNLQYFVRKNTILSLHDLVFCYMIGFSINKTRKNYKVKLSTNSILKKSTKIILEKQSMRGSTVAIHSVL